MSSFLDLKEQVDAMRCSACFGLGQCDDAEDGDISFHTWQCASCKGTGFTDGQAYQATPIPSDSLRGRAEGVVSTGVAVGEIPVAIHSNSRK